MNNKEIKLAIDNKEYNKLHKEFITTIRSLAKRYKDLTYVSLEELKEQYEE